MGGTGTLIGDPPNIMIGSAVGFSFNDFLVHSLPVVMVTWVATLLFFRVLFRKDLTQKPSNVEQLMAMNENAAIKDIKVMVRLLAIFALVIILFFFHSALHLEASMIAMIGAALALIIVAPKNDP